MVLSDTAIKRPVFTTMLLLSLLIFGYLGVRGMGVDQFPDVDFPIVTVTTVLIGAGPEIVEAEVTKIIEDQLNTIEGVKHVSSTSGLGVSMIVVEFELERDLDIAAQDVRDKVSLAKADLPIDSEEPIVQKVDINAQPVVWIALTGTDVAQLSRIADETLKPRLQTLQGVGEVRLAGIRDREMRIWLDRGLLALHGLTAVDVIRALQTKNVELPAGLLEGPETELRVNVRGQLSTEEEFNLLVVAFRQGAPIRVSDIGFAEDGLAPRRSLARFNGVSAVGLGVAPRPGSNTVAVAGRVRERLDWLQEFLPPGVEAHVATDLSTSIEESIDGAAEELILGALFAVLIVFAFLRNFRPTLVVALTIPVSLIATFGAMRVFGFSINNITMLALALSVGVVVDDAIIVLENIYHHLERGENPVTAASKGTSEIAFAALAATLSIAAVFVPVAITPGLIGRFLFQFGISVAVAVFFSLLVALTATPMLSARFLHHAPSHGRMYTTTGRWLDAVDSGYRRILEFALSHRLIVLGVGLAALVSAGALLPLVGTEFVPDRDESVFVASLRAPIGSSLDYTDRYLREAEAYIEEDEAISSRFAAIGAGVGGVENASLVLNLVPPHDRKLSQQEIMSRTRKALADIPGVDVFVERMSLIGGGQRNMPIQIVIAGPELRELERTAELMVDSLERLTGFMDMDYSLRLDQPEVNVSINRDLAASMGVDVLGISQTLNAMIGGVRVSHFKTGGERYDVRVQVEASQRAEPGDIDQLTVRSSSGRLVRLANLVEANTETGPSSIEHLDGVRSVTVFANLEDVALGDALPQALAAARAIAPPGYTVAATGQSEQFGEAFSSLLFALGVAIVIIYIVLAIQFEHFIHPVTLMVSLPLAVTGAFALMLVAGTRLGIMGMIGMILLMGLVMKNSILLIDLTRQLREGGAEIGEALREACPRRLRPILMTSFAIIFGMLPVAMQLMPGSELRAPMAIAVIGGIVSSTLLTLLVVPVVYTFLDPVPSRIQAGIDWVVSRFDRGAPARVK